MLRRVGSMQTQHELGLLFEMGFDVEIVLSFVVNEDWRVVFRPPHNLKLRAHLFRRLNDLSVLIFLMEEERLKRGSLILLL